MHITRLGRRALLSIGVSAVLVIQAQATVTKEIKLNPEFSKFIHLLETPSYIAPWLESQGIHLRGVEKWEIITGGELVIKFKDDRFLSSARLKILEKGAEHIYHQLKVDWSVKPFTASSDVVIRTDTSQLLNSGLVKMTFDFKALPLPLRTVVEKALEKQKPKDVPQELQNKLLGSLNRLLGSSREENQTAFAIFREYFNRWNGLRNDSFTVPVMPGNAETVSDQILLISAVAAWIFLFAVLMSLLLVRKWRHWRVTATHSHTSYS